MIAFWFLALALIASGVFVITASKPVYSVVGLLGNFVALAVMYLTLQAEFLAVIQIVVYSGAILILFLFVIALLSSGVKPFDLGPDRLPKILVPAAVVGIVALGTLVFGIAHAPLTPNLARAASAVPVTTTPNTPEHPANAATGGTAGSLALGPAGTAPLGPTGDADVFGSVGNFGATLFTRDLLPFEVTALLLMVAVIGVVLLAGDEEPPTGPRRKPKREPIARESISR